MLFSIYLENLLDNPRSRISAHGWDNLHIAAVFPNCRVLRELIFDVVTAFDMDIGLDFFEEGDGCLIGEWIDDVYIPYRVQHEHPGFFIIDWTTGFGCEIRIRVTVHEDDEDIPECACLPESLQMTGMEDVKTSVGGDNTLTRSSETSDLSEEL